MTGGRPKWTTSFLSNFQRKEARLENMLGKIGELFGKGCFFELIECYST